MLSEREITDAQRKQNARVGSSDCAAALWRIAELLSELVDRRNLSEREQ